MARKTLTEAHKQAISIARRLSDVACSPRAAAGHQIRVPSYLRPRPENLPDVLAELLMQASVEFLRAAALAGVKASVAIPLWRAGLRKEITACHKPEWLWIAEEP